MGTLLANASSLVRDRLARAFPSLYGASWKHDFRRDYGWLETLQFQHFHEMYSRNGIAAAAIDKAVGKTWQSMPALWESETPAESKAEKAVATHFTRKKLWRALMEADRRSMVGCYAGAILLLRDGKQLDQPVTRMPGGVESLVGVIPAWEGQITVAEWDQDQTSDTYGQPLMFFFDEQAVSEPNGTRKSQVRVYRDRMLIWSDDGTMNCRSALEPGFDDLTDAMKIKGAGGEGFWKSARGAPIITAPTGVTPQDVVRGMSAATNADVIDKLNEQVGEFQSGFDKALMLGGFGVQPLNIALPQPREFWEPCVQSFAASMSIPFKELIGNITGERASTEDAEGWARTCMSRRENRVLPILYDLVERLVAWGVLDRKPWTIGWDSLLEDSPDDKLGRAKVMSEINSSLGAEPAFLPDEIREAAGFKPSDEVEGFDEFLRDRDERARRAAEDGPTVAEPEEVSE